MNCKTCSSVYDPTNHDEQSDVKFALAGRKENVCAMYVIQGSRNQFFQNRKYCSETGEKTESDICKKLKTAIMTNYMRQKIFVNC